eukprot:scaffold276140_cov31-Tisochrysis_lutea.AAC.3
MVASICANTGCRSPATASSGQIRSATAAAPTSSRTDISVATVSDAEVVPCAHIPQHEDVEAEHCTADEGPRDAAPGTSSDDETRIGAIEGRSLCGDEYSTAHPRAIVLEIVESSPLLLARSWPPCARPPLPRLVRSESEP